MDYSKQIFKMLDIEPKEEFNLIGKPAENDLNYYLDSSLNIYFWDDYGKVEPCKKEDFFYIKIDLSFLSWEDDEPYEL